eukprot:c8203_g1_i3.p1 GENE.c8203_g1_i3~~c8203_g1_i3.p1  ORF type:complete len:134 (-),score=31.26 c8203_g1_i3:260-661(-)
MKQGGVTRYSYLSGGRVSQTGSMFMFARVKGEAERRLQEIGFATATMARPGGILDRGKDAVKTNWLEPILFAILPRSLGIPAEDVAKAMVRSTLVDDKNGELKKGIWEMARLKLEAAAYTAELEGIRSASKNQ